MDTFDGQYERTNELTKMNRRGQRSSRREAAMDGQLGSRDGVVGRSRGRFMASERGRSLAKLACSAKRRPLRNIPYNDHRCTYTEIRGTRSRAHIQRVTISMDRRPATLDKDLWLRRQV